MTHTIPPELSVALIMAIPALAGGWLAYGRGMKWPLWGLLCGVFPVFLMVVWFTKPKKEVKGFFRLCPECGEWIKWRETPCHYCAYRQEQEDRRVRGETGEPPPDRP